MSVSDEMNVRLVAAFAPERGDDGSGESHFAVLIRAQALAPLSRVARHRAVHQALGDLTTRVHAIALDIG